MKSVLISIQPQWCELIASGKKTIEVRKTRPKIETPFKCYIYMTQGKLKDLGTYLEWIYQNRMKVIGEFVCNGIDEFLIAGAMGVRFKRFAALAESCLTVKEMREYAGDKPIIYAWHISDLKIYDKPKELSEFKKPCNYKHPCCLCKYFNYDSIYEDDDNAICKIEHITRPPQSWCYVEELVGE